MKKSKNAENLRPKSNVSSAKEVDEKVNDDAEDNESIIITGKRKEKLKNNKSSILKRKSTLDLSQSNSGDIEKESGKNADSEVEENNNYTIENDINGVTSVSEPSTRVHTTHPSHQEDLESGAGTDDDEDEDEDNAVIDDCKDKLDVGQMKTGSEKTSVEKQKSEGSTLIEEKKELPKENVKSHQEQETVDTLSESEKENVDNPSESEVSSQKSDEAVADENENEKHSTHDLNDPGKAESVLDNDQDEQHDQKADQEDDTVIKSPRQVSDDEGHVEVNNVRNNESPSNESDKDLVLEDDLHVSDAEDVDETPEPTHNEKLTENIKDDEADDEENEMMKYFGEKVEPYLENEEESVHLDKTHVDFKKEDIFPSNDVLTMLEHSNGFESVKNHFKMTSGTHQSFDATVDQIVADVTTKAVINKEKQEVEDVMDFSAFNWKPNVDFFQFGAGGGGTSAKTDTKNIFSFGQGAPPTPHLIKKKQTSSSGSSRPRSKSLQRLKRTGVT